MKQYKSESFSRRIEFSLAGISISPDDEYVLVNAYYDVNTFDCELCNHKGCMYAFVIENQQSKLRMIIGSECINHFSGRGIDIDLAKGLMSRVKKASDQARKDLKTRLGCELWESMSADERSEVKWYEKQAFVKKLGDDAYKAKSREEKRELITNEYLRQQVTELLTSVSYNKSILSEEDINLILDLNMSDAMDKAIAQKERLAIKKTLSDKRSEVISFIDNADMDDITFTYMDDAKKFFTSIDADYNTQFITSAYSRRIETERLIKERQEKYGWLLDYSGENLTVLSIRRSLSTFGRLSDSQVHAAKECIRVENEPKDEEFDEKINKLLLSNSSDFVKSVHGQYLRKGFVSPRQREVIERMYDKEYT